MTNDFILRISEGIVVPLHLLVFYVFKDFFAFYHKTSLGGGFKKNMFTSIWGRFPIWPIFFRWVETTNQISISRLLSRFLNNSKLHNSKSRLWGRKDKGGVILSVGPGSSDKWSYNPEWMAENKWVWNLGLFHPAYGSCGPLLITGFPGAHLVEML